MKITAGQVKEARSLVAWSQAKLAAESGLAPLTIKNFEEGKRSPSALELSVIRRMLENAGIEFVAETPGGPGARLRASGDEAAIPPIPPDEPYDGWPV
jgi:transcriptional regulator with XRE-family HTH domain